MKRNKVTSPKGLRQNRKSGKLPGKGAAFKKMKGRPELPKPAHNVQGGAKKRAFRAGGKTLMTY